MQNKIIMKTNKSKKVESIDYSKVLRQIMPRQNGTPEQFAALAESLKRGLK